MGTVEDNEFCHHLWVVNGKQPRDGPTPVMADEATSVVSLEANQMDYYCNRRAGLLTFSIAYQCLNTDLAALLLASTLRGCLHLSNGCIS